MKFFILLVLLSAASEQRDNLENNAKYQCGIRRRVGIQLIERGWVAELGQWPWHAGIYHFGNGRPFYKCGGTLIDQRHVVTSAHCVMRQRKKLFFPMVPRDIWVHLGQYDLLEPSGVQIFRVIEVHAHESFSTNRNDIAVLVLIRDAEFSDFVIPICLDETADGDISRLVGQRGSVAGWGLTENRTVSQRLRTAQMPVVDHIECVQADPALFGWYLDHGMFCAGERNKTSVCSGDSGEGLYFSEGDRWVLKGVVSFSGVDNRSNCDTSNFAGFANVQHFLGWIRGITAGRDSEVEQNFKKRRSEVECDKYRTLASNRLKSSCFDSQQPHSVALVYYQILICSGVLLSRKFVLSTCECTGGRPPHYARIASIINVNVTSVVCHPDFVRYENDVALLELKSEVPLSATIIPTCLASDWTENLFDTLLLTGFHLDFNTSSGVNFTEFKQSVANQAISREECSNQTQDTDIQRIIDAQICVYSPERDISINFEENDYVNLAGSALQTFNSRSCTYTIVGICVGSSSPERSVMICSRVSRLLDWIESVVWRNDGEDDSRNVGAIKLSLASRLSDTVPGRLRTRARLTKG